MAIKWALLLVFLFLIVVEPLKPRKTYIVVLKSLGYREKYAGLTSFEVESRKRFKSLAVAEHSKLLDKVGGKKVHDFFELSNGFSAVLTENQAEIMKNDPKVLHIWKDAKLKLLTSHSFHFLGLDNPKTGVWRKSSGLNATVGIIDTGVWPESASFSHKGLGPPPSKFKGKCNSGNDTFTCNKKLIGARYFGDGAAAHFGTDLKTLVNGCGDVVSPRDKEGHGSHTASTAAGSLVRNVFLGETNMGSTRGMAFSARVAAYKACWCDGYCFSSDVVAAMDQAVADGVDVLSLSLGAGPSQYGDSTVDVKSYFSLKSTFAGVPVVFAGGNDGPSWFTVANSAPWVLTVAASTIDRDFASTVYLGNKISLKGASFLNPGTPNHTSKRQFPLIWSEDASLDSKDEARICYYDSLSPTKVKGKIVLCMWGGIPLIEKANVVLNSGGIGVVILSQPFLEEGAISTHASFPLSLLPYSGSLKLQAYMNATKAPTGYISSSAVVTGASVLEAPMIARFSSSGPNGASFSIMKPDVAAPGVNILGAISPNAGNYYAMLSGTSMATPHVAGVIALLKSLHPHWLPSYFFSALQTTASQYTNRKNLIPVDSAKIATPFSKGSGHINPNSAADPGLVYPISDSGYDTFLCSPDSGLSLPESQGNYSLYCKTYPSSKAVDLNIPSITFFNVKAGKNSSTSRTLKNVGPAATYYVRIDSPAGSVLTVTPTKLKFAKGQTLKYNVTIVPSQSSSKVQSSTLTTGTTNFTVSAELYWTFGAITWIDNKGHSVRSVVALNAI